MCDRCNPKTPATPGSFVCDDIPTSPRAAHRVANFSNRASASPPAAPWRRCCNPAKRVAQVADTGNSDAELSRVQGQRRILLKGGVVLTLDPQVGDFAKADVLIEDGKIREISPNIAVSGDAVAVIDASNRVVIPGFVDTHSHSYQGLLRNILISGLLNPDYNRDIQTTLTPAYQAADAYAGILVTALGMIDTGTTAMVDISQVSHTPEHSDACVRALQESGIRAVYAYHRGAGPAAQYPQDIKRLQRTYFSSKDQLLTLALTANLNANVFTLAREVGVPVVQHLVGNDLSPQAAGARPRRAVAAGRRIHSLLGDQRRGLAVDQGHRRTCLNLRPDRYGNGAWVAGNPGGARPRVPTEPELGPWRRHRAGFL